MSGKFTISVDDIKARAKSLADAGDLGNAPELVRELNDIIDETYETARGRMIAGINLTDAYVRDHMQVRHASAGRGLVGEILAPGGKGDQTPLGRYVVGTATRAAPGAKGSPAKGIPAGRKFAGIEVEVGRGHNVTLLHGFTMPLKNDNGLGVFLRTKYGLVRHRYGPAPYQLFRVVSGEIEQSVGDTVEERLGTVAQRALEKALA